MRRFSAQYILTNSQPLLKRGVITTKDDGEILSVENTEGNLKESRSIEFFNGIIIPGFVNCHCHMELSHLKGAITGGKRLASNNELSILSGIKILQENYPTVKLEDLIRWATINGARTLGEDQKYGKIEPGMKPGLLVLENLDLINFKLLPETTVTRLI